MNNRLTSYVLRPLCLSVFVVNLFFAASTSYGQIQTCIPKQEIDSLKELLPALNGKAKVDHLNLIATSISQRYPDSCLYFSGQALSLADSLDYDFGKAEALFNIGNGYFFNFDVKEATLNYLASLRLFETFEPSEELGNLYLQIAVVNQYIRNFLKAIEYYRKSASVFRDLGDDWRCSYALYVQLRSFIYAKMYDSAFYYTRKNIAYCKSHGFNDLLAMNYNILGITYLWRDDFRPEQERFEGPFAIPYFDSALAVANMTGLTGDNSVYLLNKAESYHHYMTHPDRKKAEKIYLESIRQGHDPADYHDLTSGFALLGELYVDEKKYQEANVYLDSFLLAMDLYYNSDDTTCYVYPDVKYKIASYMYVSKSYAYRAFFKLYKSLGEFDTAFYYYNMMVKAVDSLQQMQARNQIDYLVANYEDERTFQTIQLLEHDKELHKIKANRVITFMIVLGIISLLILLLLVLFIRQSKFKAAHEKSLLERRLLRTQMNPHFIFNSLASIQNFIVTQEPMKASTYLSRFSNLVRNILDNSLEEYVSFEDEIATIENYLELQRVRYEGKFDYSIDVDPKIDVESMMVPPMLAQPFIENSIEHGFRQKDAKGTLSIRFIKQGDDFILFEVEDDGIGRDKACRLSQLADPHHRSLATSITQDRLAVINRKLKQKLRLEIIDLKDEAGNATGTKVRFMIPVKS